MKYLVGFVVGALLVSIYTNYEPIGSGQASVTETKERILLRAQSRNG